MQNHRPRGKLFVASGNFCHLLDNLCKQFGPRSGLTKCRSWSGSKMFDTISVPDIFFFEKKSLKKWQKKAWKITQYAKRVKRDHALGTFDEKKAYACKLQKNLVKSFAFWVFLHAFSCLQIILQVKISFVCLFDLILYVPSTNFQLNRDRSSWVEPVQS